MAPPAASPTSGASTATSSPLDTSAATDPVGVLYSGGSPSAHYCTAGSVTSPHGNLLITAAHCVPSGQPSGDSRVAFVPALRSGVPFSGGWTPKAYVVDPRWTTDHNPDLDVAFIVLQPRNGENLADIIGSDDLSFDAGYAEPVHVTGYPLGTDEPITCDTTTNEQSPTQLRIECGGFAEGTSGSPWVVRDGERGIGGSIVGVIGGYQQGGDTPDTSYSSYFGTDIQRLYARAVAVS